MPGLGETFFDYLETRMRRRNSGKVMLPEDAQSFNVSIAVDPVLVGWKISARKGAKENRLDDLKTNIRHGSENSSTSTKSGKKS